MKTAEEWDEDIRNITNLIYQKYPELAKFIPEIPYKDSGTDEVTTKGLESYYNSLEELVREYAKTHDGKVPQKYTKGTSFPGYPPYPPSEDIYNHAKKEMGLNPEDPSKSKTPNEGRGHFNEKDFQDDMSGGDLDVPGSELDDQQESVGSEDEENNYYSLGGDNHDDLDEDKG
jgi:hypothetical protein